MDARPAQVRCTLTRVPRRTLNRARRRLTLEEALSEHFAYTHRCEQDRLKAATSVLRSFHSTVSSLPLRIAGSSEKVSSALQLIRPDKDVLAIVERLR